MDSLEREVGIISEKQYNWKNKENRNSREWKGKLERKGGKKRRNERSKMRRSYGTE